MGRTLALRHAYGLVSQVSTWNLRKLVSKPMVEDLPWDTPAPTIAPLWIMGPSWPQGRPEDTEPKTANTCEVQGTRSTVTKLIELVQCLRLNH